MITIHTFKRLALAIKNNGEVCDRKIDDAIFRVCEASELVLVLTEYRSGWIPEGIIFNLFGEEFYLTPDGAISITEKDDAGNDAVYSLTDEILLGVVSSFLSWRLKIIEKLKV